MRTPGLLLCLLFAVPAFPQPATPSQASTADPGQRQYDNNCSVCHGGDGAGGELAPSIVFRLASRTDAELAELIKTGTGILEAKRMCPGLRCVLARHRS